MSGSLCGIVAIVAVFFLFTMISNRERVVGRGFDVKDITDFYYTYSSSTYPPAYQRYRFYVEDGRYKFYHEKRSGVARPLTEGHITLSGHVELSEEEWTGFLNLLEGGIVRNRVKNIDAGDSGPWLYLYRKGDEDKSQEFSFENLNKEKAFEEFCERIVTAHTE